MIPMLAIFAHALLFIVSFGTVIVLFVNAIGVAVATLSALVRFVVLRFRRSVATILLVIATPALAQPISYPITIPQECFELALHEGVPTVMQNKLPGR
jgi:hypothetical protein